MKYSSKRTVVLAGLVVCAGISIPASQAGAAEIEDGFGPVQVAPGLATGPQVMDVLLPYLNDFPEGLEGNQQLDIRLRKAEGGYRVDIEMSGYLDDAIAGEHYRGFIIPGGDGWELREMSVKPDCWRGEAVNGRCP